MTLSLVQTKFYISFQDGRAEGEKDYDTWDEANTALQIYDEFNRRGMCIMSYQKQLQFLTE